MCGTGSAPTGDSRDELNDQIVEADQVLQTAAQPIDGPGHNISNSRRAAARHSVSDAASFRMCRGAADARMDVPRLRLGGLTPIPVGNLDNAGAVGELFHQRVGHRSIGRVKVGVPLVQEIDRSVGMLDDLLQRFQLTLA